MTEEVKQGSQYLAGLEMACEQCGGPLRWNDLSYERDGVAVQGRGWLCPTPEHDVLIDWLEVTGPPTLEFFPERTITFDRQDGLLVISGVEAPEPHRVSSP